MKKIFVSILLVVMVISLMACDTQMQDAREQTPDTQEQTADVEDEQTDTTAQEQTTEDTTEDETDTGEESSNEDAKAAYKEFKGLVEENPEYHVEYMMTKDDTEKVTIYTKDGKTRMELKGEEEYTVWMNGDSYVKYQGNCVDLSAAKEFGFDPESIYDRTTVSEGSVKAEEKYLEVSSIGTKTIAGKTTQCYEFVYDTPEYNQLTTYCMTDEGIPALMKTENRDTGEVEAEIKAQTIEASVSDEVLEPCEPNMDVSGFT